MDWLLALLCLAVAAVIVVGSDGGIARAVALVLVLLALSFLSAGLGAITGFFVWLGLAAVIIGLAILLKGALLVFLD